MSERKKVIVLGGGAGGVSAAWFISQLLDHEVYVYEKSASLGGTCESFKYYGFNLDYGPHKIYSVIPGVMDLLEKFGGEKLIRVKKRHKIIFKGKLINYPVRLADLPKVFSFWEMVQCTISVLFACIMTPWLGASRSYKDYVISRFGKKLYELIFEPLAEKTWGSPETLSADIALRRIPVKGAFDLIMRTLKIVKERGETQADYFLYPLPSFGGIINNLAGNIKKNRGIFYMERFPLRVELSGRKIKSVTFNDGSYSYPDIVVSSIPLAGLVSLLFPNDASLKQEVSLLEMRNFILVYLFINRPKVLDDQWIFCPDKELIFSRLSEQKLMSKEIGPEDKTVVCCDFTCSDDGWQWLAAQEKLAERCMDDLEKLGLLHKKEIYGYCVMRIPSFYPRYGIGYKEVMSKVFNKIRSIENLVCTGRLGLYNYNNFDHCIDMGRIIAEGLSKNHNGADITDKLIKRSSSYHIVD